MARPRKLVNVWDREYQELMVQAHAQDTQVVAQEGCTDVFVTGDNILDNNEKKYQIK